MSSFNNNLKNINIVHLLLFFIVSYFVLFLLGRLHFFIDVNWVYVFVLLYFIFKLRNSFSSLSDDFKGCFVHDNLRIILIMVVLNIFFSYGMLYLANSVGQLNLFRSAFPMIGGFISTVFISSICEELMFRGVLISKLKLIVPTTFAILISALVFGLLHSYGSMFSAFVFAVCMGILYVKTDNICIPIFAHFLNNLLAEIIVKVDINECLFSNSLVMAIMSLLALISAMFLSYFIITELNNIKYEIT